MYVVLNFAFMVFLILFLNTETVVKKHLVYLIK